MIVARRLQTSFGDGLIREEVSQLWEPWMLHADALLDDEKLLALVHKALSARCRKSQTRGRPGTTAEVILRTLVLKHVRNWSYQGLTREYAPIWCTASSPTSAERKSRIRPP